jgi:hypothetical protein
MYRGIDRLIFTLAILAPAALGAQDQATPDSQAAAAKPRELLSHTFTLTNHERVKVGLVKGERYRIELEGTGIRFQIKPVQPGMQRPRVQELMAGQGVAGTILSRIEPLATGEYYIETVGGDPGRPVRVTLSTEPRTPDDE